MQLLTKTLPWKPTHIIPLGDIQYAGKNHFSVSVGALQRNIARALEYERRGDTVLFLGMGDYIDFMSPSNRARKAAADFYDTAVDVIDAAALALTKEIFDLALHRTVGKWVGLGEGHHFTQLTTGDTTDMALCKMLKAPFLGTTAITRLDFVQSTVHMPVSIFSAHGCGNGQTAYYPLMRLQRFAQDWEGIDVFVMGHTTKQAAMPGQRVRPRWATTGKPDLTHRPVYLVGSGGYSKAYAEFSKQGRVPRGGYAEKGMMNVSTLGSPVIHITPTRDHVRGDNGRKVVVPQISVEVW